MNSLNPLTISLEGSHLIEASAGTGKTYTIAALYVRLILGHNIEKEFTPQNILVVTFTDAATEELRDRIRHRLSQTAQYFRQQLDVPKDDFLIQLRESYLPEKWAMCAKRLEVAANYMDEAAVFTIHSWCNKMLQQHAFDSGGAFKQDVNTDDTELLNTVIRDYWRVHFYGLPKKQCDFVVQKLATSPDDFADKITKLIKETEALKLEDFKIEVAEIFQPWLEWSQKNSLLETTAKEAWKNDLDSINALLIQANEAKWLNGTKYNKATFNQKLNEINQWAIHHISYKYEVIAKFGHQRLTNALNKAHQAQAEQFIYPALSTIDTFVTHCLIESSDKILNVLKLHAIQWIRNRYTEEKKKLSRVTFEDMLNNFDLALQGQNKERLSEIIRNQYPVALIDEFQDTDPVQYRIFSTLYQPQTFDKQQLAVSCFLIGDPKQAIYSFRGADIYTYLKAHQTIEKKNHHTLDTNFRSTQGLIAAINQLFEQAETQVKGGAFRFNQANHNPLPFISVRAKGRENVLMIQNEKASALTFWNWQSTDPISTKLYREEMAKSTASEIVRLLSMTNTGFKSETDFISLKLSDIAILVRSHHEAKIIRRELSKHQLKSVFLSERDSIYDTDEAKDVLMWLEAMAQPRHEQKVRTALSTGTLNFTKEELYMLTSDEVEWERHLERFLTYQTYWQADGILPALRRVLHDYGLHLTLNDENESERKLTNVLHLAELLQQNSSKIEGEEALIRHFAESIESKNNRSGNDNVIHLESDANLIKIVTIHKSKGLEYPLVFLPFAAFYSEVNNSNSEYYKYHNENGDLCIDLDNTEIGRNLNDKERLQEELRLLYVAITRAQYACWLGIAPIKKKGNKCQLHKTAIGHLLNWEEDTPPISTTAHLERVKGKCNEMIIADLPNITKDKLHSLSCHLTSESTVKTSNISIPESWWVASYSTLKMDYKKQQGIEIAEIENAQEDTQREDEETEFLLVETEDNNPVHALPKGAKPGVLIHALFEKCGDFGFLAAYHNNDWRQQKIAELFSSYLWNEGNRHIIHNTLIKWLEIPLVDGIRFIDLEKIHYKSELEFLIGADSVNVEKLDMLVTQATLNQQRRPSLASNQINGFLKGFIDLVFCYKEKYYVVDYKFNYLGNSTISYSEKMIKETMLAKRYDLQYSLYLLALHRLLKIRLGEDYCYDKHIGGAIYVFLRGNATVFDNPPQSFIENLDALFSGKYNDR